MRFAISRFICFGLILVMAGRFAQALAEPPTAFHRLSNNVEDSPEKDGWTSEVYSQRASRQLDKLLSWLSDPKDTSLPVVLDENAIMDGANVSMERVASTGVFLVSRLPHPTGDAFETVELTQAALRAVADSIDTGKPGSSIRIEYKNIGIELRDETTFETEHLVNFNSVAGERNSTWIIDWRIEGETPLIQRISIRSTEQVEREHSGQVLFEDISLRAIAGQNTINQLCNSGRDLVYGMTNEIAQTQNLYQGIAVGDVNGDGLDDVYMPQPAGLPNRLLVARGDGQFDDFSKLSGTDWMDQTRSALFADLDNDGDQDLAVATVAGLIIMENKGHVRFAKRRVLLPRADLFSIVAADVDGDARLDLYCCNYADSERVNQFETRPNPLPYYDANTGGPNALLVNAIDGDDWAFTNATAEFGLDKNNTRFSMAAAFEDYDNDGDLDLYVANDFGRNNLYRFQDGRFDDVAGELGIEDTGFGMSVTWGDADNNGSPDLYVSNMYSSAGNRITRQSKFTSQVGSRGHFGERLAKGNSLFLGDTDFLDASAVSRTTMGRWSWCSLFADVDNSGRDDLIVANGYLTNARKDDL